MDFDIREFLGLQRIAKCLAAARFTITRQKKCRSSAVGRAADHDIARRAPMGVEMKPA
jgi:hypothetical protein